MIAYLSGKLLEKNVTSLIVDVGGVGYEVFVPLTTFYEVGEIGSMVSLRIYTHVREDSLQLYGFLHEKERQLFLKLISVQGISAKSGISILSSMNADELIKAILNKDITKLMAIPGIGRKTAERLTIELRDKLKNLATFEDGTKAKKVEFPEHEDVIAALVSLGYQKSVAESAVKEAMKEETEMDIKKLLRKSLQILSKV
ncbi:MAG: Holliday junction branch migration protein RuvA [Pyrinomonadaceae bacterium]|nr:Holliday junction branch migration protein RuvA [Pyrinomonadaceae bacterium]